MKLRYPAPVAEEIVRTVVTTRIRRIFVPVKVRTDGDRKPPRRIDERPLAIAKGAA